MPGHGVCVVAHRLGGLPETERCEPTDRSLADTNHIDQARSRVEFGIDLFARRSEVPPRATTDIGAGNYRHPTSPIAINHAIKGVDAAPCAMPAEPPKADSEVLFRSLPASRNPMRGQEIVKVLFGLPDSKESSPKQVGARAGVIPIACSEELPELQPWYTSKLRSVGAKTRHCQKRTARTFANQMEGCNSGHVSAMLSAMDSISTFMPTIVDVIIAVVIGYLVGSIPVANAVAKRQASVDLRTVGDRNPGFWNARETLGKKAAIPVLVGDVAKGVVAAGVGVLIADDGVWGIAYVATAAAMIGHAYPIFANFKGGRSILTFVGGAAVFAPVSVAISVCVLIVVFACTRSLAWGSRAGMLVLPFVHLAVDGPYRTAAMGALMTIIGIRFAIVALDDRHQV